MNRLLVYLIPAINETALAVSLWQLPGQKPHMQGAHAAQWPAVLAVTWLPRSRALAQVDQPAIKTLFQLEMSMSTFERGFYQGGSIYQVQYIDLDND